MLIDDPNNRNWPSGAGADSAGRATSGAAERGERLLSSGAWLEPNLRMAGAVLAELSLMGRIDTDLESLILLDATETEPHNTRYWVERLSTWSESVISQTMDGLVQRQITDRHLGEFYTLTKHQRHRQQ